MAFTDSHGTRTCRPAVTDLSRLLAGMLIATAPVLSSAACREGSTVACTTPEGCNGRKVCEGGRFGPCEPDPSQCTTACGTHGMQLCGGPCVATEVCNGCDDDADSVIDNGLTKCAPGSFPPLACSSQSYTAVPLLYSTLADLPGGAQNDAIYANSMSWDWRIFTNPYVSSLGFDFGEVAFSAGDYLKIASFEQLTSAPGGWRDYAISGTGQSGVNMRVYTDATVGGAGFTMSQARILCSAGGSSTTPLIYPLERAEGVLAGTHDAIYFMLPGSTAATYISLQGVPATSDFDLYLGRNALPTSAGFFSRAVSISSSEALVIPATSSADTWYLVVHSWNGAGSFRLRFSRVKTGEALALSAGFDHIPTTAEVDALSASLGRGMRRFFGMTEGQVLVTSIDIFRNGSCSNCNGSACHICSRSGSGRPNSTVGGCQAGGSGRINLYPNDPAYLPYTDLILAHELGHCALSLPDEYADHGVCHTDDKCSHSMMSSALYYRSWNLCLDFDHGKDSVPSGHVCTSCTASGLCTATCNACTEPSSVWFRLQAAGRVTDVPVSTPDNESFADEPGFGALMSIVVH